MRTPFTAPRRSAKMGRSPRPGARAGPMNDLEWMAEAIGLARRAAELGEVPVGAVVVSGTGEAVGRAHNTKETNGDPLGHAEILALRQASQRVGGWRLSDCTLYVTLEPCA